jgi:hypothetical protein
MLNRSISLIWSSRPEEAEQQAQAALDVQPTSPEAISVLVMARRWQLDYAGAMQVVDRVAIYTGLTPRTRHHSRRSAAEISAFHDAALNGRHR